MAEQRVRELPLGSLVAMVQEWHRLLSSCTDASGLVGLGVSMALFPAVALQELSRLLGDLQGLVQCSGQGLEAGPGASGGPGSGGPGSSAGGGSGPGGPSLSTSVHVVGRKQRLAVLQAVTAKAPATSGVDTLWEAREAVNRWLLVFCETWLRPMSSFPLHEGFVLDQVSQIKKALAAAPRVVITAALADPSLYLPSCSTDRLAVPDACLVYKECLAGGRRLSVFDMFEEFVEEVHDAELQPHIEEEEAGGGSSSGRGTRGGRGRGRGARGGSRGRGVKRVAPTAAVPGREDPGMQARYLQATRDLKVAGVLRPVARKPDYLDRTVFDLDTWM